MSDATAPDAGDGRPRPQYGEYASPEEQRARIRQPDASWAIDTGQAPGSVPAPSPRSPAAPAPRAAAAAHPVDRLVTWVLLGVGLVSVVINVPGYFALDQQLAALFTTLGIDEPIADPSGLRLWGAVAAVVLLVGYALTAWWAWAWLRRGRRAFWIPLVGAAVTLVIASVCINGPLTAEPGFIAFTEQILGAAPSD